MFAVGSAVCAGQLLTELAFTKGNKATYVVEALSETAPARAGWEAAENELAEAKVRARISAANFMVLALFLRAKRIGWTVCRVENSARKK